MNLPGILCDAVNLFWLVLILRIILSWVPNLPEPVQPIGRAVSRITDPVLNPFRGLLPPVQFGGVALDLSPILLFLLISLLVRPLVCGLTGGGLFAGV